MTKKLWKAVCEECGKIYEAFDSEMVEVYAGGHVETYGHDVIVGFSKLDIMEQEADKEFKVYEEEALKGRVWINENCRYGWTDINSCGDCPVVNPPCPNKPTDEQVLNGWTMADLIKEA